MKARALRLAERINAHTLRERVMLFAAAAAAAVFVLYALYLNPLTARREALRAEIGQQRDNIGGIDGEIGARLQAYELDPHAAAAARLAALEAETAQLSSSLRAMQQGLVAPERIAPLLDSILRANGRLQLVSMTTLPPSPFSDGALPTAARGATAEPATPAAATPAAPTPAALLYRHGVELTVRGNYLDMVAYLAALEALPTQLFWGRAALEVEQYPNARLSLTVYTLSLDKKWMKL